MNVRKWRARGYFQTGMLVLAMLPLMAEAQGVDDSHKAGMQVRDAEGRGAFIIELKRNAADSYAPSRHDGGRFADYHRGKVVNLVEDMEWSHRLKAVSMTSWSSMSFTAYLNNDQIEELRNDERVAAIMPNTYFTVSDSVDTTAVWNDSATTSTWPPNALWNNRLTTLSPEIRGWGQAAVTNASLLSNARSLVYVVDGGVSQHEDLNVIEWVNPVLPASVYACGTRTGVAGLPACTTAVMPKVVACGTHSTGVAGIIGAKLNTVGIKGVNPNTKIVSVSVLDPTSSSNGRCLAQNPPVGANVKAALDWVAHDIATNVINGIPAVVNISLNWVPGATNFTALDISGIKSDMASLGSGIPGAFVVQSGGNYFKDACGYAYTAALPSDGIMVVGAINNHGQPVVPLNGADGFWREWSDFGHELGSNWGTCIEAWAPGDVILMPVGDVSTSNSGNIVYHSYAYGSGTSFAAPHVAGLAAYIIDTTAVTSAAQVEQQVRAKLFDLGSHSVPTLPDTLTAQQKAIQLHNNASGAPIKMPTIVPLGPSVPHNTPYAEIWASGQCLAPTYETIPPSCFPPALDPYDDPPTAVHGVSRDRGILFYRNTSAMWIAFDSYGAPGWTCDVKYDYGLGGTTTLGSWQYHWLPSQTIGGQQSVFSQSCTSANVGILPGQ
jgi:subtilisin family serine protease